MKEKWKKRPPEPEPRNPSRPFCLSILGHFRLRPLPQTNLPTSPSYLLRLSISNLVLSILVFVKKRLHLRVNGEEYSKEFEDSIATGSSRPHPWLRRHSSSTQESNRPRRSSSVLDTKFPPQCINLRRRRLPSSLLFWIRLFWSKSQLSQWILSLALVVCYNIVWVKTSQSDSQLSVDLALLGGMFFHDLLDFTINLMEVVLYWVNLLVTWRSFGTVYFGHLWLVILTNFLHLWGIMFLGWMSSKGSMCCSSLVDFLVGHFHRWPIVAKGKKLLVLTLLGIYWDIEISVRNIKGQYKIHKVYRKGKSISGRKKIVGITHGEKTLVNYYKKANWNCQFCPAAISFWICLWGLAPCKEGVSKEIIHGSLTLGSSSNSWLGLWCWIKLIQTIMKDKLVAGTVARVSERIRSFFLSFSLSPSPPSSSLSLYVSLSNIQLFITLNKVSNRLFKISPKFLPDNMIIILSRFLFINLPKNVLSILPNNLSKISAIVLPNYLTTTLSNHSTIILTDFLFEILSKFLWEGRWWLFDGRHVLKVLHTHLNLFKLDLCIAFIIAVVFNYHTRIFGLILISSKVILFTNQDAIVCFCSILNQFAQFPYWIILNRISDSYNGMVEWDLFPCLTCLSFVVIPQIAELLSYLFWTLLFNAKTSLGPRSLIGFILFKDSCNVVRLLSSHDAGFFILFHLHPNFDSRFMVEDYWCMFTNIKSYKVLLKEWSLLPGPSLKIYKIFEGCFFYHGSKYFSYVAFMNDYDFSNHNVTNAVRNGSQNRMIAISLDQVKFIVCVWSSMGIRIMNFLLRWKLFLVLTKLVFMFDFNFLHSLDLIFVILCTNTFIVFVFFLFASINLGISLPKLTEWDQFPWKILLSNWFEFYRLLPRGYVIVCIVICPFPFWRSRIWLTLYPFCCSGSKGSCLSLRPISENYKVLASCSGNSKVFIMGIYATFIFDKDYTSKSIPSLEEIFVIHHWYSYPGLLTSYLFGTCFSIMNGLMSRNNSKIVYVK